MNDLELLLVLGPLVLILAIACEISWRNRYVPQWLARKVLHIAAVGSCAAIPLWLEDLALLRWIVIFSEIILIWLVVSGRMFDQDGSKSWGILLFPLPYLFLLFVEIDRWLIALPMAILALSDGLAAVAGILFSHRFFRFTGDPKSFIGSCTFFCVTVLVLLLFPDLREIVIPLSIMAQIGIVVTIALLLTAIEALASRGTDNFFIPISAWLLLKHLSTTIDPAFVPALVIACTCAIAFIAISIRMKWLTVGGAIAASLIGVWVIYFAGPLWLIPLFLFLIASTLIGALNRSASSSDPKHGKPRDAIQVICNGGIYAASAALFHPPLAALAMAVSISISAADTWASEVGMIFRGRTIDIFSRKPVPSGLSGGISVAGTIGAVAASILFAIVCIQLIDQDRSFLFLFIAISGMKGMLLDSFLGSRLQPRFRSADGSLWDTRISGSELISGKSWMTNDAVNIVSNCVVTVLFVLLFKHFRS